MVLSIIRGHWAIENCCNYVKDVTFGEDACRVKNRNGSQLLSSFRNLAITSFRKIGMKNMAKAKRFFLNHDKKKILQGLRI